MNTKLLNLDEMEIRIKFDSARAKYTAIYGESIFKKCVSCKGTGLFTGTSSFGYTWDCNSYCSDCDGFGGMFTLGEIIFECNECKGEHQYEKVHCKKCHGTGYVDWIENLINKQTRLPSSYKPLTEYSRLWGNSK